MRNYLEIGYFCLFLKTTPSHTCTCSISWSWLLCFVPPTYSCFEVSPQEDSLSLLPTSWPPASFHVVCLPPCKLGWAAGKGDSLAGEGRVRQRVGEAWEVLLAATYFQICRAAVPTGCLLSRLHPLSSLSLLWC